MSVNLVNGDTLDSDFTAICNKIREKTGGSSPISYTVGNPSNIVSAIDSISGGGGGVTPTFTETVICDNSAEGTTLTFTDDYTNYDLLLFEVYNTSTLKTSYMLTIPEVISHIRTISDNDINFNEFGNNQYVCYAVTSPAISIRTWTRYGGRNLVVKKVTGLNCSNATVIKTTFFERADRSTTAVTVEPVEDLADYDYIFLASSTNSYDETQPCFPPIKIDKTFFDETSFYRGSFFKYNDTYGLTSGTTIGHHSIDCVSYQQSGNYYLMCAYGLKFENAIINYLEGVSWVDNYGMNSEGTISPVNGFRYSDFIDVTEGETYLLVYDTTNSSLTANTRIHGYNSSDVWQVNFAVRTTSYSENVVGIKFTVPTGSTKIRISTGMASYGICMMGMYDSSNFIIE